ncbi:MAG: hypothetical protein R2685_17175 [Candidatus Nitrosocosmicus sp.]|nr:hypothetical protein [Candidatus Nitrosocosmicus sp.]
MTIELRGINIRLTIMCYLSSYNTLRFWLSGIRKERDSTFSKANFVSESYEINSIYEL